MFRTLGWINAALLLLVLLPYLGTRLNKLAFSGKNKTLQNGVRALRKVHKPAGILLAVLAFCARLYGRRPDHAAHRYGFIRSRRADRPCRHRILAEEKEGNFPNAQVPRAGYHAVVFAPLADPRRVTKPVLKKHPHARVLFHYRQ